MATNYGLLKGKVTEFLREDVSEDDSPHFQIVVRTDQGDRFRVPVNVLSTRGTKKQRDIRFHVDERFDHPILDRLVELPSGLLNKPPRHLCIDYARGAFVSKEDMVVLPPDLPGPADDVQDEIQRFAQRAQMERAKTDIYVAGEPWHDKVFEPDKLLGTSQGVHKVHRNQGRKEDAGEAWDDGALFFHFQERRQWVAMFFAFQNQSWVTDLEGRPSRFVDAAAPVADQISIVGAMVAPPEGEKEWVLLLNAGGLSAVIGGWKVGDKEGREETIADVVVPPYGVARVELSGRGARLPDRRGTITLMDPGSHVVDAVRYSNAQRGRMVTFR